ncbi:kinase-like domain-containing protein [Radiomyces spectabilis]|uniref:kinase-like domain-containing protein n=1 Tax=Radiomyces spectabilis TaxID=64574 RepID=UPI0022204237|nr:kinase-like domain-containing protein [Radiomyces spectabilis]KAI8379553.1 kinase-like domain-containing protein [Radiomyces spectabilis]
MGNVNSSETSDKNQVELSHFRPIKIIGKGSFGKVHMVQHIERRELYALKSINKEQCIKMKAVYNIIRERTILEQLNHPLICNMRFAFQDDKNMYMAMDLMLGGDLRFHLSRSQLSEEIVRFWMAELTCAVKYLHSQGLVHRDIKPDNVLLDQEGHVHLSDFNIACRIPRHGVMTSQSGTAAYFAPEVFKGCGYTEDVDWWSVGITFYECIYGKRPWRSHERGNDLRKSVLYGAIAYPQNEQYPISPQCISAISGFLEHDPRKRLGHGTLGWARLMQHPFFQSVPWQSINAKECDPPFKPSSSAPNFDAFYELEENVIEICSAYQSEPSPEGLFGWLFRGDPKKTGDDGLSPQRREHDRQLMEESFHPFDCTIYEQYEGFLDPERLTVGPPPTWVKPAFRRADNGNIPSMKQIPLAQHATVKYHQLKPSSILSEDILAMDHVNSKRASTRSVEGARSPSRADSACTLGSTIDECKNKRRSSSQSFKERRERDRRRSAGYVCKEANGIIATAE